MGWACLVVSSQKWVDAGPKMCGCSLFMFNFLVVGEGCAMHSAVLSKFFERSLVDEANEGKGKSKNIRKSEPSPLIRLYVPLFLTFFSCEIARQKQEIFDSIYNLMKDAQQWRTQIVFSTSCPMMTLCPFLGVRKLHCSARNGKKKNANMARRQARSVFSMLIVL